MKSIAICKDLFVEWITHMEKLGVWKVCYNWRVFDLTGKNIGPFEENAG